MKKYDKVAIISFLTVSISFYVAPIISFMENDRSMGHLFVSRFF